MYTAHNVHRETEKLNSDPFQDPPITILKNLNPSFKQNHSLFSIKPYPQRVKDYYERRKKIFQSSLISSLETPTNQIQDISCAVNSTLPPKPRSTVRL